MFAPKNVRASDEELELAIQQEHTPVRELTAAAIASRMNYLYGTFTAELRPAGLFLHRNGPRQELNMEFLGRDTTKILVNVFFNPGSKGTKLEYGFRGTPTEISLGFDAAADLHRYEINWQPERVVWTVVGVAVYERMLWNPTPIPDCPLELNLNLWHSRSTALAGELESRRLPTQAFVRSIALAPVEIHRPR